MRTRIRNLSVVVLGTNGSGQVSTQRTHDKYGRMILRLDDPGNVTGGSYFVTGYPMVGARAINLSSGTLASVGTGKFMPDIDLLPIMEVFISGGTIAGGSPNLLIQFEE